MRHRLVLILWFLGGVACTVDPAKPQRAADPSRNIQSPNPGPKNTATIAGQSDIRKIDFENYSYPLTCDLAGSLGSTRKVALKNGSSKEIVDKERGLVTTLEFGSVSYADVDGDSRDEEALVVLAIDGRGSAMNATVFIFGMTRGVPTILWQFDTGDRSHGGLRDLYGEKGDLVVERFNNDVSLMGDGSVSTGGACCAKTYTRAVYQWSGLDYQLVAAERRPNPTGGASRVQ